ncbi:MAG TPA: signal recognition particle receptor subunit alpha [Candidatus Pacearchaeota archaeon]|nr:signal recognition particle receptor subunit alpha [Candidatus Pacearchaeota archaeon]
MLEKLGQALKKATDKIANAIFLDKNLVDTIVRELQRALIEADVNIALVKELTDTIKKAAFDERIKGIEKKEHLIKVLHDELVKILGGYHQITLKKEQNRIMLLGLYGSGKTTTIAKLGNYYAKRGKKVALIGLDVHRPAAFEQLQQLAEKNNLNCFVKKDEKDPVKCYKLLYKENKLAEYDVLLVDTAGRHTLDDDLIKEIKALDKEVKPTESILVIPADIGQAAKKQAKEFRDAVKISGIIITRMDSSARGGGALTACAEVKDGAGVYFITTGEKINDLEEFNPESFLSRLLGMGDLQALVEKVKSVTDEGKQKEILARVEQGKLTLDDVVEQVKSMNSLGGFEKIKSMLPGFGKVDVPDELMQNQQGKIAKWEHIIKSMTKEEKENPELLQKQTSRINRIAKGAGVTNSEIRALLKQYDLLNSMVKEGIGTGAGAGEGAMFSQKQLQKMMKKFGKKMKF